MAVGYPHTEGADADRGKPMALTRRTLIKAGAASGALLMSRPLGALAAPLGPTAEFDTSRSSPLFPGTRLVHADLHNHTLYSDGNGDPQKAFASMRAAGLDVAALTDHSTVAKALPDGVSECQFDECQLVGIDEGRWQALRGIADAANDDGEFTSIRGFEWSSPTLGHMNVWFSETWVDPLSTGGTSSGEGLGQYLHDFPELGPSISGPVDAAVRAFPVSGSTMRPMYEWLNADPSTPVLGGGSDGIAGFNHPGREPGRFGHFVYDPRLRDRLVSMEVFNRGEDYLFEGVDVGIVSPITDCLDKGWRVGLLGVTDEHGTNWGYPDGKGRTGLYVRTLTRAGVREAMQARRFFCTRLRGFRVGATANRTAMGSTLRHRSGPVQFAVDIDRGSSFTGMPLSVQVLMTGTPLPTVVHAEEFPLPRPGQLLRFTVPIDVEDGRWVVLRISDPRAQPDRRASEAYRRYGNALAYTSPFFLDPEGVPAPAASASGTPAPAESDAPVPVAPARGGTGSLPATGTSTAVAGAAAALTALGAVAARNARDRAE